MLLSKQEARSFFKKQLNSLAVEILEEKGHHLSRNILEALELLPKTIPSLHQKFIIGAYAPLKREADLSHGLIDLAGRTAFPGINESGGMRFQLADYEQLEENRDFGVVIKCPSKTAEVIEPAVILVPGLGFTEKGERLGRGGGYYDKYLENYPGFKIGICLEEQLCSELPVEDHDCKMDVIITDKRVIAIASEFKGEIL